MPTSARLASLARAALTYWAVVFAFAFGFGIVRTLWLVPMLGSEVLAVLAEIPFVLAASWLVARRILERRVFTVGECAAVGALAFVMLMGAELALATLAFGQTPHIWLTALFHIPGTLGLAGQLGFAAMPMAVRVTTGGDAA